MHLVSVQEMVSASGLSAGQTSRVLRILEDYLSELERGGRPCPDALLAEHPDLAEILRAYLDKLEVLHRAAVSLRRSAPSPEVAPGSRLPELGQLGDFRIVREIGRGGMGVVYEAIQLSLGRHVALKVLPVEAARDAKLLARFRRESQAAAQLHHSNIVPVFEVGQQGDVCFYAMQYIQGQPLDAVIRELQQLRAAAEGTSCPEAVSAVAQSLLAGRFEPARSVDATLDYKPEASGESQPMVGQAADTSVPSTLSLVASDPRLYYRQVARLAAC